MGAPGAGSGAASGASLQTGFRHSIGQRAITTGSTVGRFCESRPTVDRLRPWSISRTSPKLVNLETAMSTRFWRAQSSSGSQTGGSTRSPLGSDNNTAYQDRTRHVPEKLDEYRPNNLEHRVIVQSAVVPSSSVSHFECHTVCPPSSTQRSFGTCALRCVAPSHDSAMKPSWLVGQFADRAKPS